MPLLVVSACVVVIVIGLVVAIRATGPIWRSLRASRWPEVTGVLLEVEDQDVSGPEDTQHRIRVLYRYEVDGRCYEGTVIHPAYQGGSRFGKAHLELLELLRSGERYRVRYRPDRADQSTMSAGFHLRSLGHFLIGTQWSVVGSAMLAYFGMGSAIGQGLFSLAGMNLLFLLVILLISSERFASRIRVG